MNRYSISYSPSLGSNSNPRKVIALESRLGQDSVVREMLTKFQFFSLRKFLDFLGLRILENLDRRREQGEHCTVPLGVSVFRGRY